MIIEILQPLYKRDLEKLRQEIGLYSDENLMWKIDGDVTNSAGNLCLHLIGNLNGFIGAQLGKSGYVRERDLEFSTKETSRAELLSKIDGTIQVVADALDKISDEQLGEDYPLVVFAEKMTTGWFLIHLATHLNYHLGQINYHRRIFGRAPNGVG
ncbi:MAG: DinB family protein [Pyrinomonadaceae bacterium]